MKEEIKNAIMILLQKNKNYAFSELIFELENLRIQVKGERELYIKNNLIIWEHTNSDFNSAIVELLQLDKIEIKQLSGRDALLVYAYSGVIPDLPIATKLKDYSTPHWLPVIINRKLT